MHGLINRSVQCFVRDTYGAVTWAAVAREARLGQGGYEPMLASAPGLTSTLIDAVERVLGRPRDTILEDLGTYLVSHANMTTVRRLLRFAGVDFLEFLHSLQDLHERARLAVDGLNLPVMDLRDQGDGVYLLRCSVPLPGVGHVIMGLLRAMADDYGALVFLDHRGTVDGAEVVSIRLLEHRYAAGRPFDLAVASG
jgi:hypothetical protein